METTPIATSFKHRFFAAGMKKGTVTSPVVGRARTVDAFDETYAVTLHDGTVVPMGTLDGRLYVRAPWTHDVPSQGRHLGTTGGVREWIEPDPRWDEEGRPPDGRPTPRSVRRMLADEPAVTDGWTERKASVEAWLGECVVVDGVPYAPTAGVTVHLVRLNLTLAQHVPMVWFGLDRPPVELGYVPDWCDGWEPPPTRVAWNPGAIDVPPAVLAPPGAIEMARVAAAHGVTHTTTGATGPRVSPHWLARAAGDWVADAALCVRDGGPSSPREGTVVSLGVAIRSMDPDRRARFDALVGGDGPGAAPTLDALSFGG